VSSSSSSFAVSNKQVKVFHDDEAVVYGTAPGKGKHTGRVGALLCRLPNGRTFRVGTGLSDALRNSPPAVGTVITFK
jgi:DNA ligase-1